MLPIVLFIVYKLPEETILKHTTFELVLQRFISLVYKMWCIQQGGAGFQQWGQQVYGQKTFIM